MAWSSIAALLADAMAAAAAGELYPAGPRAAAAENAVDGRGLQRIITSRRRAVAAVRGARTSETAWVWAWQRRDRQARAAASTGRPA
jgi:hypothetical protein